ncbi:hypothetical protein KL86CLO1_10196 [uncultured Eubacteriales bacterium]|uniref:Uncharacterized protein n=1 Tax=uncultured Eubacteriales bacterium TaxID=172733 RepID=A0A212IXU7_9FIRM|nr:hypothetical protein KL86CLO1_10196 [uncultured Eubacteriales bacterium]
MAWDFAVRQVKFSRESCKILRGSGTACRQRQATGIVAILRYTRDSEHYSKSNFVKGKQESDKNNEKDL